MLGPRTFQQLPLVPLAAGGGSIGLVEDAPEHQILKRLQHHPKLLSLPISTARSSEPIIANEEPH